MIYCLMNSGKPINNEIRTELLRAAQKMFPGGKRSLRVRNASCQGTIKTKYGSAIIGGISGTEFIAEIVTPLGEAEVNYIVRDFDLPQGEPEWYKPSPDQLSELAKEINDEPPRVNRNKMM